MKKTSLLPEAAVPHGLQSGTADVTWLTQSGKFATAPADTRLLDRDLHLSRPIREPHRYPRQRNYQGLYYFAQTSRHVWHESLLEATVLRWLDIHEEILAIASQPFKIEFADGTTHIPDYFALLDGHRQVVYDVKPTKYLDEKALLQFAKTRAVCNKVGWEYEVRTESTKQVQINLEWVAAFKHPGFHPGPTATQRLWERLTAPATVREAIEILQLASPAHGRSSIYHLVCARILRLDLSNPLSDLTLVERNPNALP